MSGSFKHGTCAGYERHNCRCDLCRKDHNARVARNRADRLARVGELVHGRRSTYDAGCRCTKCRQVRHDGLAIDKLAAERRKAAS